MMTLTENELTGPIAEVANGDSEPRRVPIADVAAYLDGIAPDVRPSLKALGELLVGVVERPDGAESADRFTARCLGVSDIGNLVDEEHELTPVAQVTTALVLAEWIDAHEQACEVGAGQYSAPPRWTQTEIGGRALRHPQCLRAFFPAGTVLADVGCVIGTVRTGRFDAIVEVGYPSRAAAARILAGLVAGLPGGSGVDTATVVAGLPEQISGSDLREIVRRAVLSVPDGEPISTDGLLAEVGGGRYRAAVPEGLYL